ncbi:unnamed protein product, partial [Ophioblennius macclurei]
SSGVKTKA